MSNFVECCCAAGKVCFRCFGLSGSMPTRKMSMWTGDMEMNREMNISVHNFHNIDKEPEVSEIQASAHGNDKNLKLLTAAYDSVKCKTKLHGWSKNEEDIRQQKSPMGNTVLHITAMYGYEEGMREILVKSTDLLTVQNSKGDTALHLAANAGHNSCLKGLLDAYLKRYKNPKQALEAILVRNDKGNNFFHEAVLNGREGVGDVFRDDEICSDGAFRELVERAALFWINKEGKSVLYLAIEGGYHNIVEHALKKLISQHIALENLIENHRELAEMMPHGPDYAPAGSSSHSEQDQGTLYFKV